MSKKREFSRFVIPLTLMLALFSGLSTQCKTDAGDGGPPGGGPPGGNPPLEGWGSLPIGGGGFVTGIIVGKNTMYLRTDVGGAYRFENDRWVQTMGFVAEEDKGYLHVESLAIDPNNDNIIYLLVGCEYFSNARTAIIRSTDGGRTYTTVEVSNLIRVHGNGAARGNGERIAVDPTNSSVIYAGGRTGGLIKSTNGGGTWSMVTSFPNVMTTTVNWPSWTGNSVNTTANHNGISSVTIAKNGHVFVTVSRTGADNVYRSTDGGSTWSALSASLPTDLFPLRTKLNPAGNLLITYSDKHDSGKTSKSAAYIYNVTSNTLTNITVKDGGAEMPVFEISWHPNDPNKMVAATTGLWLAQSWVGGGSAWGDMIFTTSNGGTSWTKLNINLTNGGVTWIKGNSIHWASSIVINPQNHNQMLVTSGNGVFASDNIWAASPQFYFKPAGVEEVVALDFVSVPGGKNYSAIGDYDGFIHSDLSSYPPVHTPSLGTTSGIAYNPHNKNTLMRVAGMNEYVVKSTYAYYTTNGGTSWQSMNLPVNSSTYSGKCAITTVSGNNRFLWSPDSKESQSYYSNNNGSSWTTISGLPGGVYFQVDSINANNIYAAGDGKFFRSTDGGVSFSQVSTIKNSGIPVRIAHATGTANKVFYPATDGLYVTTDGGTNFTKLPVVTFADAVGVGKGKTDSSPLAIYIWGKAGASSPLGIYRSVDDGQTWVRINDNNTQFGGPGNGKFLSGDMNVYGRVYMSSVGLGIISNGNSIVD